MAPPKSENANRRKSVGLFSSHRAHHHQHQHPSPPQQSLGYGLTLDTNFAKDDKKKLRKRPSKRTSLFHIGGSNSPDSRDDGSLSATNSPIVGSVHSSTSPVLDRPPSAASKPRTLQKGRPSSVFGSLGRRSTFVLDDDEAAILRAVTLNSPIDGEQQNEVDMGSSSKRAQVLHHGEVQTTSGLFRKKKEYMVLTDTHLIRFKSQSRASEAFPSIPSSFSRTNTRHPSTTSIGSLQDAQSTTSQMSADGDNAIPLNQIVTAYRVDDGRPFFTTEVVWLDEEYGGPGSIQMMLYDPKEADLWHTSIRGAAQKARLVTKQPFPDRVVRYLANVLEAAQDYDAEHFRIFRVVRRAAPRMTGRSSSDDLAKLGASVFYLVIGVTRLHLIPVPDYSELNLKASTKALKSSFGLVTLIAMDVDHSDDAFDLGFRNPLQTPNILELAASSAPEIITLIFQSIIYLKPQWLDYTFLFGGPKSLLESSEPVEDYQEDNGSFDRTLVAYCLAYKCNPSNIVYTVDYEVDDAPEFRLLRPALTKGYTSAELLAVMRALRYNECFQSISFNGVNLQSLHGLYDSNGFDHIALTSRSGADIRSHCSINPELKSLLYQETQALALKAKRLRRLDFGDTLPKRRPRDSFEDDVEKDPGCEIASAILPLCRAKLTNVDSIVLSGIELGETDLEEFIVAFESRKTGLRSLDVSRCSLGDRGMQILFNKLEHQNATLECLHVADNPGRLSIERFPVSMSRFSNIRRLDISRLSMTSGDRPLLEPKTICSWKLEELILTGVSINDNTLDAIAMYLASEMSESLYLLQMDQCNLTGGHVALLLRSMTRKVGEARNLHLSVSANRLEKDNEDIVKAIEQNQGPSKLTMRLVDYLSESHFRELLKALKKNKTIKSLDISKATLPYDAGDDTCEALRSVFAENSTLEELDISGEQAHLEIARFGIGLSEALTGLKNNKALKVLRIEHQKLGLEGANALSSVLEANETLTHIYCDRNDFSLQAFTILVNALEKNFTVLDLPYMVDDQAEAARRLTFAITENRYTPGIPSEPATTNSSSSGLGSKISVRKTLGSTFGVGSRKEKPAASPQDVQQAVQLLNQRWQRQIERMTEYLIRNQNIALNLQTKEEYIAAHPLRPMSAIDDAGLIEHALSNSTPRIELDRNPVDVAAAAGLGFGMKGLTISDGSAVMDSTSSCSLSMSSGQSGSLGSKMVTDRTALLDPDMKNGGGFMLSVDEKGVFDMET